MFPFLLIAGMLGQGFFQTQAAKAQEEALNLQAKQANLQHAQRTLKNYGALKDILDTQLSQASTRGVALNSPSFNAIQRKTFNTSMENQRNINIEDSITAQNINTEKKNVRSTLHAQLFGDAASTFASLYSAGAATPFANNGSSSNLFLDVFGSQKASPITTLT